MTKKNTLTHSKERKALELVQGNRLAEARALCMEICRLDGGDADAWFMLGTINGKLNNAEEAIDCFRRAVSLRPDHALAHFNLGMALRGQGRNGEAVDAFREVTRLAPQRPEAYVGLGQVLMTLGRFDEAGDCLQALLKLTPRDVEAWANRGRIFHTKGYFEEAVSCYRRALQLEPGYAAIYDNLACVLCSQGRYEEALANHRKALDIIPGEPVVRSNLLLTLNYFPDPDPEEVLAEHKRWAQIHAPDIVAAPVHANTRDPNRRLRVGYVSSDLRSHAVAYFFEPLLANHEHSAFEVICYSGTQRGRDATTQRLQSMASQWRETLGLNDEQLADLIRADGIDILVDLAGHTSGNRLKAFAHRPAPVQVTWLGYPNTTGLAAMDYRLTDELADPQGEDVYYTEKLLRLPGAFLCYQPLADCPPVAPLPAIDNDYITFGSFNNSSKINLKVIELWAGLLRAVPGARLFIKSVTLTDAPTRERYYDLFEKQGAGRDRVELRGRTATQAEHLALYSRMDIALDTFPYNGTTTTCEALWMGVPVITLAGRHHVGRVGVSLLSSAGFPEWIAESPEQYIALAAGLAADIPKLAALRAGLRARMAASPLCDGRAFARKVESVYREMWRAWCASA